MQKVYSNLIELLQPDDWVLTDTTLSPHQFIKNTAQILDNTEQNNELWASNTLDTKVLDATECYKSST